MTIYTTNRVRFASGGDVLVGDLHRPVETSEPFDGAVVVVTGSWTTSKEQQADFYARRLAAAGISSLTFDFRGFGQSRGQPRDWENPERKIADINAAITHLTGRGDVDPDRIGAVGGVRIQWLPGGQRRHRPASQIAGDDRSLAAQP